MKRIDWRDRSIGMPNPLPYCPSVLMALALGGSPFGLQGEQARMSIEDFGDPWGDPYDDARYDDEAYEDDLGEDWL